MKKGKGAGEGPSVSVQEYEEGSGTLGNLKLKVSKWQVVVAAQQRSALALGPLAGGRVAHASRAAGRAAAARL